MKIENLRLRLADLLIGISDYLGVRPPGYKMKVKRAKKTLLTTSNVCTNKNHRQIFCAHHVVILGRICNTVYMYPDGYCECEICGGKFRIARKNKAEVEEKLKSYLKHVDWKYKNSEVLYVKYWIEWI